MSLPSKMRLKNITHKGYVFSLMILSSLFFLFPFKAMAWYCYGVQLDSQIVSRPATTGDFFNSFKANSVLSIASGRSDFIEWSNIAEQLPQYLYITVPDKLRITSTSGHSMELSVSIDDGYSRVTGYSSSTVGSLSDAYCDGHAQGKRFSYGRYNGKDISITLTGSGVHDGVYDGEIPYYYTYGLQSDEGPHWDNFVSKLVPLGRAGTIPVKLVVQNQCIVSSPEVTLNYGKVTPNEIDKKSIQAPLTVTCKNQVVMKYSIKGVGGSETNSASCGAGGECYLFVNKNGDRKISGEFTVGANGSNAFAVESEYKSTVDTVQAGQFEGSGVLTLLIE